MTRKPYKLGSGVPEDVALILLRAMLERPSEFNEFNDWGVVIDVILRERIEFGETQAMKDAARKAYVAWTGMGSRSTPPRCRIKMMRARLFEKGVNEMLRCIGEDPLCLRGPRSSS